MTDAAAEIDLLAITADIVAAHVANNRVHTTDLPTLIQTIHGALSGLSGVAAANAPAETPTRAVSEHKSLADPKHILSMINGKPYKLLATHIAKHGYTPASYRETFGLSRTYPLVAPAYSDQRRAVSREAWLGRQRDAEPKQAATASASVPAKSARPRRPSGADAAPAPTKSPARSRRAKIKAEG